MSARKSEHNRRMRHLRNARLLAKPAIIFDGKGDVVRGAGRNNFTYGPNRQLAYIQQVAASRRKAQAAAEAKVKEAKEAKA